MSTGKTALERAFEIARLGETREIGEIRKRLLSEGFAIRDIVGRSLCKQLMEISKAAAAVKQASSDSSPR